MAFERHLTAEDFTDMDQRVNSFLDKYDETKMA